MSGTPSAPRTAAAPRQQEEESPFKKIIAVGQQVFIIYVLAQLVGRFFNTSQPQSPPAPSTPSNPSAEPTQPNQPPAQVYPAWSFGAPLDLHVHFSTDPYGQVFGRRPQDTDLPSFAWYNITYGNWSETRQIELALQAPLSVKQNGSLWADIFLTKNHASPDPSSSAFDPQSVYRVRKLLTRYIAKPKVRKEKMLLGQAEEQGPTLEEPEHPESEVISYWYQNLTLALVSDGPAVPYVQLPPPVLEHVHLVRGLSDETGTQSFYYPIVFPNEFWHLRSHYVEINETTTTLPLQITFQPMSYFKFQMFASLTFGFQQAAQQQGGASSSELDEMKRVLLETNPWYLGLTGIVSVLHVLFEMLAFTSDVSHWRNKRELVGVSVRTILINVFTQFIILLYLLDNNEETSWMILMSSGMGVLIEAWKITKAVNINLVPSPQGSSLPYKLEITDKHVLNEDEKRTQEYDKLAFRYVSYVAIPCLAIYSVYSLLYESHRGWYSYVITTLTSFVYMFGFAQLVPQLIINYKLKSVAHMPMKAMVYKTLSTVIDDLFAFIIKMPILHRLACFRDDVVFLIFLYQRYIYRVDPKRVNEYGQVMVANDDAGAEKTAESKKTR